MKGTHSHIRNQTQLDNPIDDLRNQPIGEFGYLVKIETGKATTAQRNSMHLYFRQLAQVLNDAGLDMVAVLNDAEIPWSEHTVKSEIWGKVMKAITDKTSTTQLDRDEVSKIYEVVNRHLASTFGVMLSFPNRFGE